MKQELRIEELEAEHDRLRCVADDALIAVEEYPVRTTSDLTLKIALMEGAGDEQVHIDGLLADLRRIGGRA